MKGQTSGNSFGILGLIGVLLLSLFCCGGPGVIALLGSAGIGTFLIASGMWWIAGGFVALILVSVLFLVKRRRKQAIAGKKESCSPMKIMDQRHEIK